MQESTVGGVAEVYRFQKLAEEPGRLHGRAGANCGWLRRGHRRARLSGPAAARATTVYGHYGSDTDQAAQAEWWSRRWSSGSSDESSGGGVVEVGLG